LYKVKFNNRHQAAFSAELKQKVNAYFTDNNISPYANTAMVFKTIFMLLLAFVPYSLILLVPMQEWQMLLLCVVIGFGVAGIGFAIQHDANHGAYSPNEKINRLLGFTLTLVGGNDYMWRIKHNVLHHTYTNIHGKDEDISVVKFLRLAPTAEHKPIHRIQHYIAWFAYSTLTFFWVFYFDFPKLSRYNGNGSVNPEVKHPRTQVFLLFFMKLFYYFYAIVLPILVLNIVWWKVLIGFTVAHLVSGFVLTTVFQLAHVVEDMEFPMPTEEGNIETSWMVHQMETTANFSRNNPLITWYVGGLNYQIEHHLFPKICSIHYPAISNIVKEVAEKYGISYHYQNSLGEALKSHYKMLKQLSKPEVTSALAMP
jgi:linoleoyl-CoA desaturase